MSAFDPKRTLVAIIHGGALARTISEGHLGAGLRIFRFAEETEIQAE